MKYWKKKTTQIGAILILFAVLGVSICNPLTWEVKAAEPTTEATPASDKDATGDANPTSSTPDTGAGGTEGSGTSSETPSEGNTGGTEDNTQTQPDVTTPETPQTPDVNMDSSTQVQVTPQTVDDQSSDAVYVQRSYDPSEIFVSQNQKTQYDTQVPLDNIPSFITQEMVIAALACQDEYGYPASVTLAQIIQESGFGKYGPGGTKGQGLSYLAYQYNNLFGIKGTGPAGSVNMRTGEQTAAGETYTITAGFRAYHSYTECIEDRASLLQRVYKDLITGVSDANTFAMRISSRWATSINYGQSLISQMVKYDLYRFDKMTINEFNGLIGYFADPCPGSHVTSTFGWRELTNSFHKGIDLGTGAQNLPTYAVLAGTVVTAGWNDSAGNWVIIDHGNGMVTKYMHHLEMYVQAGDYVEQGQQLGLSGTTGNSTGNHLHFQLEINGVAVNPEPYLFGNPMQEEEEITVSVEKVPVEYAAVTESPVQKPEEEETEEAEVEEETTEEEKKKTEKLTDYEGKKTTEDNLLQQYEKYND